MPQMTFDVRFGGSEILDRAESLLVPAQEQLAALAARRCVGAEWTGWFNYPERGGWKALEEVEAHVASMSRNYDTVVVCGIGGSYLGTRAVASALASEFPENEAQRPRLVFAGQHLSATGLQQLLAFLEHRSPVVNVISKSGTTTETSVAFRLLRAFMERRFGKDGARQRILATTDPENGALRSLAKREGYRTFALPADIGGRYSVLTPVGTLPLALAGYDARALLRGASQTFQEIAASMTGSAHAAVQYATWRIAAYQMGRKIEVLAYDEPFLHYLAEWWKQLFGESDGKDGRGLFPASLALTTDLHSLGQFVQDGDRSLIETFLSFGGGSSVVHLPSCPDVADDLEYLSGRSLADINATAALATQLAHADGRTANVSLRSPRLDEGSIGSAMAFFMTACAVGGLLLGVNPFDQPGVEAYKKNMFALLGKPGFEPLAAKLKLRLAQPN